MQLGEIVEPQNFTVFNRLLDSKLWSRDAEKFSPIDLDVMYAQVRRFATHQVAQRACDIVVLKLKAAMVADKIDIVLVEQKNYGRKILTNERFEKLLENFTDTRADCLQFALEMNWTVDQAVAFERKDINPYRFEINERAWRIIDRQVPSLGTTSVFWELVKGEHRRLISLRHQVAQVFKTDWSVVLSQYNRGNGQFREAITKEQALSSILQRAE